MESGDACGPAAWACAKERRNGSAGYDPEIMSDEDGLADELNPAQREAVEHFDGPAPRARRRRLRQDARAHHAHRAPDRAARRRSGRDPRVTFTNKAAGEMRERIARLLGQRAGGDVGRDLPRDRRAHAPAACGTPGPDAELQHLRSATDAARDQAHHGAPETIDPSSWHPKAVRVGDLRGEERARRPDEYATLATDGSRASSRDVYPQLPGALREQNAFDFDDLLVKPVELLARTRGRCEATASRFQSSWSTSTRTRTTRSTSFVELLAGEHGNLCVVGDDDQSIYGWRGADIRNILDFEKDFPDARIVRLEQNYRSTARILDAANA